jgi:hypothetical protein
MIVRWKGFFLASSPQPSPMSHLATTTASMDYADDPQQIWQPPYHQVGTRCTLILFFESK